MTTAEIGSLVAIGLSAAAFLVLERRFPYNPDQSLFRTGFWNDLLLYCFAQSYVLGIVIGRVIMLIDAHTGWSRLHLVSDWPIIGQVAFFLVLHDLYIYLFHRWQHRSPFLWRFHEAHHSVENVDWLSGVRSHSLEILVNQTIEFAPIVLLGAAPQVAVIKGAISAIWGMFIHSNVDVRLGWLQYLINGPEMHRWHHATDPEAYDKNFGTKLAIWDWLFGTAYLPPRDTMRAERYGLGYPGFPEGFPLGYFQQHAWAFRRDLGLPSSSDPVAGAGAGAPPA
ncbi:MAG TPA: sterol desaturase family protein [Gemmatimonadales bacterium]|jgi:sterol desaturase/sphingolipid hydroxylase (fatty acid hydroxylase superfamily)